MHTVAQKTYDGGLHSASIYVYEDSYPWAAAV